MKSTRLLSMTCAVALGAGALTAASAVAPSDVSAAAASVRVTPNPAAAAEPFEGWGTSLAWFANATGDYPADVRQDLFDAVFGDDGLNLNIARYNIGGGNASDVPPYLRPGGAVPGFWSPRIADAGGTVPSTWDERERYAAAWDPDDPADLDLTADRAQRWWLDALKDTVTRWEAFSNSPPYFLTQSGFVSGGVNDATSEQLAPEDMDRFAGYLVKVVDELERAHGIAFDTIDPFNEPNTDYWSTRIPDGQRWPTSASRQEGAHIGPVRQDQMIAALATRLADPRTRTQAVISAMDETNPGTFATNWNTWTDAAKDAVDQLNVHTYGTGGRLVARDIAKAADKPLWMSEVEGNWTDTSRGFVTDDIENGLGMAQHIVGDLRELEPEAWVFWQPVEDLYNMEKVERLNWGSVFIDFDCDADGNSLRRLADGDADPSCKVLTNEKFNTVRNFTHYIEPGDRLVPTDDAQTTAALPASGDGVTLVHVNPEASARTVRIDLSRFGAIAPGATVTPVVTTQSTVEDPTVNALKQGAAVPVDAASRTASVTVPAKSVTTLLVSGVSGVATDAPALADGEGYQLIGVQSGKALAGGTGVTIRAPGTTADAARPQTWTVRSLSGAGTHRHRLALQNADGLFLAVTGTGSGARTRLVASDTAAAAADPTMQWIPSTTDGRTFSLLSVAAERVLDVGGQSAADGAPVGLWTSNDGANQRWTLAPTRILGVAPVSVATATGEAPSLPASVGVRYAGGVERAAPVQWDTAGLDWATPGAVGVTGTGTDLFGASFTATATVDVGAYTATHPASLTVAAGTSLDRVRPAAPTTVPAEVRPGGGGHPVPVTWTWDGLTDASFAEPGTVVVAGSAEGRDGARLDARLTVIVTAAVERNVAPASRPSATFTESPAYGVERTVNGALTDKGWSNWRPGTKNTQDTLAYALAQDEQVRRVAVHFFRDGGSSSWAQTLRVDRRLDGGAWVPGEPVAVPAPASGAPVVEVDLDDAAADEVRVVLDARPDTHMIVSEVEILALAPAAAGIADLAQLVVGGVPVAGFDPADTEYAVTTTGSPWPQIAALPVDTGATVTVVQPGGAAADAAARAIPGVGSVRVVAPDGTERTYRVTVTRAVGVSTPVLTGEARVGSTLGASAPTDPAEADVAYTWLRDGTAIDGATGAMYLLAAADAGREISVAVAATADGFAPGAARSAAVVPVAAPVDPGTPGNPGTPGTPGTPGGAPPGAGGTAPGTGAQAPGPAPRGGGLATTGVQADGAAGTVAIGLVLLALGGLALVRRRARRV